LAVVLITIFILEKRKQQGEWSQQDGSPQQSGWPQQSGEQHQDGSPQYGGWPQQDGWQHQGGSPQYGGWQHQSGSPQQDGLQLQGGWQQQQQRSKSEPNFDEVENRHQETKNEPLKNELSIADVLNDDEVLQRTTTFFIRN